jgi:benzoyl-CoA reductase/2-hydroxyglutaryl-CoA dehydratase subunit BcrC/BadD/HgdB
MAVPNWKVPAIVESAGAVIVGEESCVGERSTRWLASETGQSVEEIIGHLTERYLQIDCMRPANPMVDGVGQPGIGYFAILAA